MTVSIVQLFANPRPGWRARKRIEALSRAFEQAGAVVIPPEKGSRQLNIDTRSTLLCAVGGDGTVRHVVEALHRERSVPVGTYPAGTVNLLARECGYPYSPRAFVQRVLDVAKRRCHYTALVNGTPLLTCASVGPDSFAVEQLSAKLKMAIGRVAYVAALCKLLLHWQRMAMTLTWAGGHCECEAVYIAKGRFFAGPWTFAPEARVTDPFLHVVALKQASRRHFAQFVWSLLRGRPIDLLRNVKCFCCTELTISSDTSAPLQADGDIVTRLPATILIASYQTEFA